jgi:LPS O-antigen subunit length determinant protein (WzzB/FepE family)
MTNQESRQQQYPQNYPPYEDEINLIDYLRVLWKWKWLIVAGTLICAVVAAVTSLQMPKIYEVSTVIEPGIAGVKDDGGFMYIDSVANISGKINGDVYNKRIQRALNLDPLKTGVKFKSANVKKANMVNITSQWQDGDTDLGMKVVRQMICLLSDDYREIIEQRKGDYDKQILMKQNEISKIKTQRKNIDKQILMKQNEMSRIKTQRKDIDKQIDLKLNSIGKTRNEIKLQQANLKDIGQRREELLEEIKGVKENTEKIIQQRDFLLKGKNPGKDISLLLYSTTIQQNVAYFNQLSTQIYDLRTREKKIETGIDKLSKDIDDIKTAIERLNLHKTEGLQAKIYDIKNEIGKLKLHKTEGLQNKINDVNAQINSLNLKKGLISNIKIIQEPEVSLYPVKPKKKQIVLLSVVVGLFFMIFLAFFIEYIKNATSSAKQK